MKKMMSRFRGILRKNLLLLCLLIGFGIGIFLALWKCSLEVTLRETKTAYDVDWDYWLENATGKTGNVIK